MLHQIELIQFTTSAHLQLLSGSAHAGSPQMDQEEEHFHHKEQWNKHTLKKKEIQP
jgi:hypothetical protein